LARSGPAWPRQACLARLQHPDQTSQGRAVAAIPGRQPRGFAARRPGSGPPGPGIPPRGCPVRSWRALTRAGVTPPERRRPRRSKPSGGMAPGGRLAMAGRRPRLRFHRPLSALQPSPLFRPLRSPARARMLLTATARSATLPQAPPRSRGPTPSRSGLQPGPWPGPWVGTMGSDHGPRHRGRQRGRGPHVRGALVRAGACPGRRDPLMRS
jgi:hypothetical protein